MKTENHKVSVIIPARNAEKTIYKCLRSVLNQTYKTYEVIVVDNNSTDSTRKIVEDLMYKYPNLSYFFEPQIGRGVARNTGIKYSHNNIIVMTDADCVVSENWIEKITSDIRKGKELVVMGGEKCVHNNYWTTNINEANKNLVTTSSAGKYVNHLDTKNCAISKDVFKNISFDLKTEALEDLDFYLKLVNKNIKIKYLPNIIVRHNHSSSAKDWFKTQIERGHWAKKIYRKYKKNTCVKKEQMFSSFSIKNKLLFIPWLLIQFLKHPDKFPFVFVSEIGWRIGTLKKLEKSKKDIKNEKEFGKFPDFIIAGVIKGGTTSLHVHLNKHPDIEMVPNLIMRETWGINKKETNFFYREDRWCMGIGWYKSLFNNNGKKQGEASPTYTNGRKYILERMYNTVPNTKIIVILRNPVDRLLSSYNHHLDIMMGCGWDLQSSFEDNTQRFIKQKNDYELNVESPLVAGFYIEHINNILKYYRREQLLILISEEMRTNPQAIYNKIFDFIGVERRGIKHNPNIHKRKYKFKVNKEFEKQLYEIYQPYNEKLFKFLGYSIPEWEYKNK